MLHLLYTAFASRPFSSEWVALVQYNFVDKLEGLVNTLLSFAPTASLAKFVAMNGTTSVVAVNAHAHLRRCCCLDTVHVP